MQAIKPIKQLYKADCGPTCIKMIATAYGKQVSTLKLREWCELNREGVNLFGISQAAEKIGFRTLGVRTNLDKLADAPLPCILHWNQNHFVVLEKVERETTIESLFSKFKRKNSKNIILSGEGASDKGQRAAGVESDGEDEQHDIKYFHIADPAHGAMKLKVSDFKKSWCSNAGDEGIVLLLEPSPNFYTTIIDDDTPPKKGFRFLYGYLRGYNAYITQVFIGLFGVSILQLIFPFLTQGIVDRGIHYRDVNFVLIILISQLMLLAGQFTIEFIRNWIMLHISSRINIALISDFLAKLIRLPHSFFETRMTTDILQRIIDHNRVQSFITQGSLMTLFNFFNFIVFSIVLSLYSTTLLAVFFSLTVLYVIWVLFFLKRRKELDYKRFNASAQNQDKLLQLVQGIHEIKMHNAEDHKRWAWEIQQVKLFHIGLSSTRLQQIQDSGAFAINQVKNILTTFISAKAVIDGEMSLGMMMSVQYIIGQLNSPVQQLIGFIRSAQDAKISLERITEVYIEKDEREIYKDASSSIPERKDFVLKNVSYRYPGTGDKWVLDDINLHIPANKVTAIVGSSGSGKTTLLKLLLKYQNPQKGGIYIDGQDLQVIHPTVWRSNIGAVMQEGFIFGDTIAGNIVVDGSPVDKEKLRKATETAQIREFIESLPTGYNTKIGSEGISVSMGQKQRLLIARAVYKNPDIILFDEATNSLDSVNERKIVEGLNQYFQNKTVVIVAHRLSTVKNADNIVVLENGKLIEQGKHDDLIKSQGSYYTLVKNQLELGN